MSGLDVTAASTVVTIGDGKTASFWTSSRVEGRTPKVLAPNLYRKARRKKLSVYKALQDSKWITHILPLQTSQEIQE
jgi:lysophospholipase L1-like esterase